MSRYFTLITGKARATDPEWRGLPCLLYLWAGRSERYGQLPGARRVQTDCTGCHISLHHVRMRMTKPMSVTCRINDPIRTGSLNPAGRRRRFAAMMGRQQNTPSVEPRQPSRRRVIQHLRLNPATDISGKHQVYPGFPMMHPQNTGGPVARAFVRTLPERQLQAIHMQRVARTRHHPAVTTVGHLLRDRFRLATGKRRCRELRQQAGQTTGMITIGMTDKQIIEALYTKGPKIRNQHGFGSRKNAFHLGPGVVEQHLSPRADQHRQPLADVPDMNIRHWYTWVFSDRDLRVPGHQPEQDSDRCKHTKAPVGKAQADYRDGRQCQ